MAQFNYRLELDRTGTSVDNRFPREPHELTDKRIRAIAPLNGAVFCDSVVVYEKGSNVPLDKGRQWRFAALHPTATHLFKKEIASLIIILDRSVSKFVDIDYQAVGSYYMRTGAAIAELINSPQATDLSLDYLDVTGAPTELNAFAHIHDLGDGVGFEYLCHMLEHLIQAQVWGDASIVQALIDKIDRFLNDLTDWCRVRMDKELLDYLNDFKKKFNKDYLGLGKVVNMRQADAEEVKAVADGTLVLLNDNENAYMTLKGLVAFKEHVASALVSSTTTFLGQRFGSIISSKLTAYAYLVNGARAIIDSLDNVKTMGADFDGSAYPATDDLTARWVINKIINNVSDNGGVVQATNMRTGAVFNGILRVNVNGIYSIEWRKVFGEQESTELVRQLYAHMNKANAHNLTAAHVKLENVANYPVATIAQVLSRRPMKAYISQEGALALLDAFKMNDWKLETNPDGSLKEEQKAEQLRRYQSLFMSCNTCGESECGCGTGGKLELKAQLFEPTKAVDVRGVEYGFFCRNGTRVVVLADGLGGVEQRELADDAYCRGVANDTIARFGIKERGGSLVGYGYAPSTDRDPNATIEFKDRSNATLCYIYPTTGAGHTIPVRNYSGDIIGYAMNS